MLSEPGMSIKLLWYQLWDLDTPTEKSAFLPIRQTVTSAYIQANF